MLRMSAVGTVKKSLLAVSCVAAIAGGSAGALAQCVDNFPNISLTGGIGVAPVSRALPLGAGSTAGALTSTVNSINTAFLTTTSAFITGGSGVWTRAVGGVTETKTNSVGTLSTGTNTGGFDLSGAVNCKTTVRQEFAGFQIGADLSSQVVGNGRWNWGVMGGRLQARTTDLTGAGTFSNFLEPNGVIPASTFTADTGIPYVGLYTAFTQGGFFVDGQVRWDFYTTGGNDPANTMPFTFSGSAFAVTGNTGYNIPIGKSGWFIEPSGGVVWSKTSFDAFDVARNPALVNIGAGSVAIDDVTSVIGRASLRVGANIPSGKIIYQPYFTYSLFHEFNGDVTVTSVANNAPAAFNGDGVVLTTKSSGGVGTYSQFALGTAAVLSSTTAAYIRGDYKIGDNLEGWGISGGVRVNF